MSKASRPFVTVVSGAPRSGTSMMMRMLEAGGIEPLTDGERTADRDNPAGYYEFERVKRLRDDRAWLDDAEGRAVKMVHVLLRDLPPDRPYRVLLMRRNLAEVVESQRRMLERLGRPLGALSDERKAEIFRRQLDDTERWLDAAPVFSRLTVDYNRMLGEPRPEIERIAAFLGGGLDVEAMAAVVDPSLYRNRR